MAISNAKMSTHAFLSDMYADAYFPNHLVDKGKALLVQLCEQIESRTPQTEAELLELTHATTEGFNVLNEEFWDADSEIETAAREAIAGDIVDILEAYGWGTVDIEEAIAPRDW